MEKINKVIKKLTEKERRAVRKILEQIEKKDFNNLDIKRLKGREEIFRIRKSDIRVIYRKDNTERIFILAIERRSEKTYRRF